MVEISPQQTLDSLDVFVGVWSMRSSLAPEQADGPQARTTFEWLPGRHFLIQRWEVANPEAPDGIAIIGFDADKTTLLQHYFDSRGIARLYEMTFADNVWTLQRFAPRPTSASASLARLPTTRSEVAGTARATARTGTPTSSSPTRG